MYESTLKLRIVRVLAMLLLPLVILLALDHFFPTLAGWQMLLIALGATWLTDQLGSFAMFCRGTPLSYQAERVFFVLNLIATSLSGLGLHFGLHQQFSFWKTILVLGLPAALCITTIIDDLYDTLRNRRCHPHIRWSDLRFLHRFHRPQGCKATPASKSQEQLVYPRTPPPRSRASQPKPVEVEKIQEEVSKSMSNFLAQANPAPNEATIPTKIRVYDMSDFVRLVQARKERDAHMDDPTVPLPDQPSLAEEAEDPAATNGADDQPSAESINPAPGSPEVPPVDQTDDIAAAISASVASTLRRQPEATAQIAAEAAQAFDTGSDFDFDPDDDPNWPHPDADRHLGRQLDIAVMRTRYAKVQNRLSIAVGSAIGILVTRFEALILVPFLRSDALQTIIMVVFALATGTVVLRNYVRYIVAKDKQDEWMVITTTVALIAGGAALGAQKLGLLETVTLSGLNASIYQLDILLIVCGLGTVYYVARGVWCHRHYAEIFASAMQEAEATADELAAAKPTFESTVEPPVEAVTDEPPAPPHSPNLRFRWAPWARLAGNARRAA